MALSNDQKRRLRSSFGNDFIADSIVSIIETAETAGSGGSSWNTRVETGNVTTTVDDDEIFMNHTTGVQVDLPASPSVGDRVRVGDASSAGASVNVITVSGNGNNINGVSTFPINTDEDVLTFVYASVSLGWRAF